MSRRRHRQLKRHSRRTASLLAVFIPGAGQAYNGRPVIGAWTAVLAPLVLPWILGIWAAGKKAGRIERRGGREGRGGPLWVVFHIWFVANWTLLVLAGLTMAGLLT